MSGLSGLLRSLLLAGILSFLAPIILLGGILLLLLGLEHIPGLASLGQVGSVHFMHFLTVFGNGSALYGVMTIGLVCSLVGLLFDSYTLYRHQNLGMKDER